MTAAFPQDTLREPLRADINGAGREVVACCHCGSPCPAAAVIPGASSFCCSGCQTVHELLHEHGLGDYYRLKERPGPRVAVSSGRERYAFLDEPTVRDRLLDYSDEHLQRVTFHVPAIHCLACLWLLENLFRLLPGIGISTVNFSRREVTISFDPRGLSLSQVAALLDSLGYPPDLKLADLDTRKGSAVPRRLWLQLGVAGFAFGNTMLFSLADYFGLDVFHAAAFRRMFGVLSLVLAIPVVVFSAADYWRMAWFSLRQRRLSLEVPIAIGIAALFAQSVFEVVSGRGGGYFDSLAGLLFFLLCGRVFQHRVFDRLTFDRDYRSFFPLSVIRFRPDSTSGAPSAPVEERVALDQLRVADRLRLRHGELIPADGRLIRGEALVDYSFVTGESIPVSRKAGELLHAGGCQTGGTVELEIVKPVSQSYLTALWNQDAFRKVKDDTFDTLTNRYSVRFTWAILAIALGTALFWGWRDPATLVRAVAGVLIVACPCALALAAPFTLGTSVRVLGRRGIYLRNAQVIEALDRINTVVFDKTGTLTAPGQGEITFSGEPLSAEESAAISALARQSTHPLPGRIATAVGSADQGELEVDGFCEVAGSGISGWIEERDWKLGSAAWLRRLGIEAPAGDEDGSAVQVVVEGRHRGRFILRNPLRPEADRLIRGLARDNELALLSGDNARELGRFRDLFGLPATLEFNQSPANKLEFIRALQERGRSVMMVGDGLNDAGALRQSEVGVAVVEQIGAFSPASDVILEASRVARLGDVLRFARTSVGLVRASFVISALYNVVGLSIAAAGQLSPVVCAVLMPLSSVTVIAFAVGAVNWAGRRAGLGPVLTAGDSEGQR